MASPEVNAPPRDRLEGQGGGDGVHDHEKPLEAAGVGSQ